ncbi:SDR family oxidoreductase [Streptomyces avicenniae]|uniref:SDR family oxidoreductase n=1 Tax=Streptomyces avicenniae TaxID=500153 RepID=UPI00069C46A7|nr:SDR family oxidoreductase [Streptomyces avicenniae]
MSLDHPLCLVTGASGYIGGRLVPELLAAGYPVRCLARTPGKLAGRPWIDRVETAQADVTDPDGLADALRGVEVAYYLVHSIGGGKDFEETDRRAATTFGEQARAAGVRRIVYLGGLTPQGVPAEELSPHLRSRAEVGRLLLASGVPTAVLRAAVVIGSGSASFEMLRQLTERLPAMVTPRWVRTRVQPIAVRDVLRLLVACATLPPDVNRTFDIGGPDVVTYEQMMRCYAEQAGLRRRLIVPVPVLTPRLSGLWVGLVTPVPGKLARPLAESLRHEVVVREQDIERYAPQPPGGSLGFDAALHLALRPSREAEATVPGGAASDPQDADPRWSGGSHYQDRRHRCVNASQDAVWRVVAAIGGEHGMYSAPLAWAARGWIDMLLGGPGVRGGRRGAGPLRVGDRLDFWRVEEIAPPRLLRLRAEMRLPGRAWLELAVEPAPGDRALYRQRAVFRPRGTAGHLYWWAVSPFHAVVFRGMVRNIAATAEAQERAARAAAARARDAEPTTDADAA